MATTVIYQKRGNDKVKVAEAPDLSPYAIKADVDAELATKADAEDLAVTDKRVDNLSALLNGALSVQQTDATAAYAKTIPAKAQPYAAVQEIGGRTLVWNQMINYANQEPQYGTYTVSDGVISYTPTALRNNVYQNGLNQPADITITGHKYLITCEFYVPIACQCNLYLGSVYSYVDVPATTWTKHHAIIEQQELGNHYGAVHFKLSEDAGYTTSSVLKVRNYFQIDLTLMFGAGNEPSTVAEFTAMFPSIDPAYNPGSLISAGVTGAVSEGKNILPLPSNMTPQTTTVGVTVTPNADGSYTLSGTPTGAGSVTFQLTHSYTLLGDGSQYVHLRNNEVNGNINFIIGKHSNGADWGAIPGTQNRILSITAPYQTVTQIKIYWNANVGTLSNFTFQPSIETASSATVFEANTYATLPIPAAVQALPGYGWSAGSVCNEVDWVAKKYIQRVASVDLGTLSWGISGNGNFFSATLAGIKQAPSAAIPANVLCVKYVTDVGNNVYAGTVDKAIAVSNGAAQIWITDSAYSDKDTFKAAMDGVTLYYELATPIETDISAYLNDDDLIAVEPGGTISFPSQLGDDYRIPVPSIEEYTIDLAPDTPSTDGTYTLQCTVADGVATYSWVSA